LNFTKRQKDKTSKQANDETTRAVTGKIGKIYFFGKLKLQNKKYVK
jgi:hypothetical protein